MAENMSIKKSPIDSVLECPLCLHQHKLPQTLQQCLHSYCKSCLDKVPQKTQDGRQGWLCPMCENFTRCDQVQQNTFIEELQKIHSKPARGYNINCEQCLDDCGPATWKCADCKIGLCENGKSVHLKIPVLKGHKIVPLDSSGESLIDNVVFCKVHAGIPAQMNCHKCEQLICYKCNTTHHQQHRAETVEQALDRILPEIESSVKQVDENIDILEAQIEGINKNIEHTKESYASCRMQMDDHLEKVICQMRAMKAQLEEEVNEQESIALDTLKELKQQLEKHLSQNRIISNLTAVVNTKTRHTSQLQQLQTGLFDKVKSIGASKKKDLHFQLPETKFIESHRLKELKNIFGDLWFDLKGNNINISGETSIDKDDNFVYHDLEQMLDCNFAKILEIDTGGTWCNRVSYINNKLCLPLANDSLIKIYNKEGKLENTINTGEKRIGFVKEVFNGDLICGGDYGLYITDKAFTAWTLLADGEFSDVVVEQQSFLALEFDSEYIHQYSLTADGQWQNIHKHKLVADEPKDLKLNCNSSLCVSGNHFWVTSDTNLQLYKFTNTGKYLQHWDKKNVDPVICGVGMKGKALIANYNGQHFYLLDTEQSDEKIAIKKMSQSLRVEEARDAVFDSSGNFWTLSGDVNQM